MALTSVVVAALVAACDAPTPEHGKPLLVVDEDRYTIELVIRPEPGKPSRAGLSARLATSSDWHLAPQAPMVLEYVGIGVEFEPEEVRNEELTELVDRVVFENVYRFVTNEDATASGRIRFGLCRDDDQTCEIVHETFDFNLTPEPL